MSDKKKTRKGGRRVKGEGAMYNETKKFVTFTLTPSGVLSLNALADQYDVSRSEFVEQVARGIIPVLGRSPQRKPEQDTETLGKK